MIQLPRIWANGAPTGRRLNPLSFSLTLSEEPPSTARFTLLDSENINVLDFVELFTPYESAGVFRVANVSKDFAMGGVTSVYCESAECTLGDTLVPGAGTSFSGNIHDALAQLLSYQPTAHWAIGTVEADTGVYLDLGEQDILSCMTRMMGSAPDYYLDFDYSSYPWHVHIRHKPTTATSEGRLGRNIASCSIQYDTADMCTRVRNDKLTNGYIDSPRINDYDAIFEQTIVLDQNATDAQRLAVAQSYMANRDTPIVSIEISALDFYGVTGVPIDKFRLRQLFRLALPDYGITQEQRIIEMTWRDLYRKPETVDLRLANRATDLIIDVARANRSSGGGGGSSRSGGKGLEKAEGDFRTSITQTERIIALTAEQISTQMNAAITVQADRITNLVTRTDTLETGQSNMEASLILMADQIASKVSQHDYDDTLGEIAVMESSITQLSNSIESKVSYNDYNGNEIASRINQTATTILLSASKINLEGYVTASELSATNANIANLVNGSTTAQMLKAASLEATSVLTVANKGASWHRVTKTGYVSQTEVQFLGDNDLSLAHYHSISASENNGVVSFTLGAPQRTEGSTNFNIAATQFYQDGVAAAFQQGTDNGAWNYAAVGATNTGTKSWASDSKSCVINVTVLDRNNRTYGPYEITVDTRKAYSDGWTKGFQDGSEA